MEGSGRIEAIFYLRGEAHRLMSSSSDSYAARRNKSKRENETGTLAVAEKLKTTFSKKKRHLSDFRKGAKREEENNENKNIEKSSCGARESSE